MSRDLNEEREYEDTRKHIPTRGNDKSQCKLKEETQVGWRVRRE